MPVRAAALVFISGIVAAPQVSAQAQAKLDPAPPLPAGVTPRIERAIEQGLAYLLRTQEADGSWGATPDQPDYFPVAVTGLVGLAFLAHGDMPTRGVNAPTVARITDYLLSTSTQNGL